MAVQLFMEYEALPERNLVILLYGHPGCGKTSLFFTANQVLLVDFDQGAERSANRGNIVKVDSYGEFIDLIEGKTKYGDIFKRYNIQTLGVDTAESLLKYMADDAVQYDPKLAMKNGNLTHRGYGVLKNMFEDLLHRLKKKKVDLVMIAHVKKEQHSDYIKFVPKISGSSNDILLGKSDLVGYLEVVDKNFTLDFNPDRTHIGKNAPGYPKVKLPHHQSEDYSNLLGRIIKRTKEHFTKGKSGPPRGKLSVTQDQQDNLSKLKEKIKAQSSTESLMEFFGQEIVELDALQYDELLPMIDQKYYELFEAEELATANTLADFNALRDVSKSLPERYRPNIKKRIIELAYQKGFIFDRTLGCFAKKGDKKPRQEPEKSKPQGTSPNKNGHNRQELENELFSR